MSNLIFGVIHTSKKENEHRVPIHPDHISAIPKNIRNQLVFETGYGESVGMSDETIASMTGGIASRHKILSKIGNVILAKPVIEDLIEIKKGGVVWGWSHCVQSTDITQISIDKELTMIAFEDMYSLDGPDNENRHTFYENNELAGYCAVLHALQLKGIDGRYGDDKKVLIIGFGSVSKGAIHALQGRGYTDITVYSNRSIATISNVINGCKYVTVEDDSSSNKSLVKLINKSDIIINGILQNPNNPITFIDKDNFTKLKERTLIIDVSCDESMGFFFAKPTTFSSPMFKIDTIDYYAVDHTPTYLWDTTSRTISNAIINYLPCVIVNKGTKPQKLTIKNATSIKDGVIKNKDIISFQRRETEHPYKIR